MKSETLLARCALICVLLALYFVVFGCVSGMYHVVGKGENLYRISQAYGVTQDEILRANHNNVKDPNLIYEGQYLFIPGATERRAVPVAPSGYERRAPVTTARTDPADRNAGPIIEETLDPPVTEEALDLPAVEKPVPEREPDNRLAVATPGSATDIAPDPQIVEEKHDPFPAGKTGRFSPMWPARGTVTSKFGTRGSSRHDGIDIAGPAGSPVLAAADGVVMFAGTLKGYGRLVVIKHDTVYSTLYAHNRRNLVHEKQRVKKGDRIAEMGSSGRTSGTHLHFEVLENRDPVDPMRYLFRR